MELKKAVHLVKIIRLKQATSDYIKINKEDAEAIDTVLEELNNRTPKERINEQIRFLNDEGYFEFNTKRDLEKVTEILNNLLSKE